MSATGNVTLRLSMSGDNSVAARLDQIKGKTNNFTKPVTIRIDLNDADAQVKIDHIFHELETMNRTQGNIHMKFPDYATAMAQLDMLKTKTRELDGQVIRERIKIDGTGQALLDFAAVAHAADNLGNNQRRGLLSRLFSGGGGGGGGGGINAFQGISGVGSGASAAFIEAITSPAGAAAAAASAPFLGTGAAGGLLGVLGTGLAGIGVAGAMGLGASKPDDIAKAQAALHTAQLRLIASQTNLNRLQASGKATASQLASAHATLASNTASVANAQEALNQMPPVASKSVQAAQEAFHKLGQDARTSLSTIGASFAPVMVTIFDVADKTLKKLTPIFAAAEKTISGPFQKVGVILAQSLGSPAVITGVTMLAKSFGEFLSAFSPQIPGIVNATANGVTGMATAFTDHPGMLKGMADVLAFLLKLPGFAMAALGSLTRVTSWLITGLPHAVSIGLDATREFFVSIGHGIESAWDSVWGNVTTTTKAGTNALSSFWTTITGPFRAGYGFVVGIFNNIRNFVTGNFDKWWAQNGEAVITIWNGVWMRVRQVAASVWSGLVNLAKGFVGALAIIFQTGRTLILGVWGAIWPVVRAVFQAAWNVVQYAAQAGWVILKTAFQVGSATISLIWKNTWAIIKLVAEQVWAAVRTVIKVGWDIIVGLFSAFINILTGRWSHAWANIYNMFQQVWNAMRSFLQGSMQRMWQTIVTTWNNVFHFFGTVPGLILRAIGNLSGLLVNVGRNVIGGLFHGILQALSNIGNWVKANIFDPIVGAIKSLFGIHSPSTVMADMGGHLVSGLILGLLKSNPAAMIGKIFGGLPQALGSLVGKGLVAIEHLPEKALHALGSVAGSIGGFFSHLFGGGGSGVSRWMGVVLEALALNGLPASLAGQVLRQIGTESGGNPNAINLSDINAQHGDPSRGLLQTIGATFAAYHVAGTSRNIYDPLANVAAAINYARHVYGPSLMSGGNGLGSGHGYAGGTSGAEAGWAWVGEKGPELVLFHGGEQVIPNTETGYAKGTHKRPRHHGIPSGEISTGISLALAYGQGSGLSVHRLQTEQTAYLKAISKYYTGSAVRWRDAQVERQTKAMENAAGRLATLQKNYNTAKSYANSVTSNLAGFAGLSNVDLSTGGGIVGGINNQLNKLRTFSSMLTKLRSRGVNKNIIAQIINMGPDSGYQYAAALVGAADSTISAVNKAESQIGQVTSQVGRSAALAVYGIDIAKGLASQERPLKALMSRLGKELGKEAEAWFHVPRGRRPVGYALGTRNATPGWHMVGENGPELLFFRGGESVIPTGSIRGGDGASVVIENLNINFRGQPLHTKAEIGRTVKEAVAYAERHGN